MKSQKNFLDFVSDVQEDPNLLTAFAKERKEKTALFKFFKDKGYTVSVEDCSKMAACLIGGMSIQSYIDSY